MVELCLEISGFVIDISNAPAHAGSEISSGVSEAGHAAAGHVFAAVVADSFNGGVDSAVADAESFPGDSGNVGLAAGGSVERRCCR